MRGEDSSIVSQGRPESLRLIPAILAGWGTPALTLTPQEPNPHILAVREFQDFGISRRRVTIHELNSKPLTSHLELESRWGAEDSFRPVTFLPSEPPPELFNALWRGLVIRV